MPFVDPARDREYKRQHYLANKEKYAASRKCNTPHYRKRNKSYVDRVKMFKGCAHCGYKKCSMALEFHHTDSANKKLAISKLVSHNYCIATIKTELRKCVILCANCHREEHERLGTALD